MKNENPFDFGFNFEAFQEFLKKTVATTVKSAMNEILALKKQPDQVELLTKNDVAKIFSVSIKTINDWTKQGVLQTTKINSRVYFTKEEINRLINDNSFRNGKR